MIFARAVLVLLCAVDASDGQDDAPAMSVDEQAEAVLEALSERLAVRSPRLVDKPAKDVLEAGRVGLVEEAVLMPAAPTIERALRVARQALLAEQNEAGTWGGYRSPLPGQEFWSNIHTHEAWTVATTGLAVMALIESPGSASVDAAVTRGVTALVEMPLPKRPSDWDVDNTWGLIYGLAGMATALHHPERVGLDLRAALRKRAAEYVASLAEYQTPAGGWGYYAFETRARRPSWATSFMTAAAILALLDAGDAGVAIPESMLSRAVEGLARCRLPHGAYSYSFDAVPRTGLEYIDQVKGSLSRVQVGNDALWAAGHESVDAAVVVEGLDEFFRHHRFLDVARRKPIPHETYYYNSGYFYFFGHFYAARLIERLEPPVGAAYAARLAREIIKTQEADGTMWDYPLFQFDTAYGTAFGIMTLQRMLDVMSP